MNKITISAIAVLLLLVLSGCATSTTSELFEEAHETGDWTAVDARFEAMDRADDEALAVCPDGTKPWCVNSTGKDSCSCIDDKVVRDRLVQLWRH